MDSLEVSWTGGRMTGLSPQNLPHRIGRGVVAHLLRSDRLARGRGARWAPDFPAVHIGADQRLGVAPERLAEP